MARGIHDCRLVHVDVQVDKQSICYHGCKQANFGYLNSSMPSLHIDGYPAGIPGLLDMELVLGGKVIQYLKVPGHEPHINSAEFCLLDDLKSSKHDSKQNDRIETHDDMLVDGVDEIPMVEDAIHVLQKCKEVRNLQIAKRVHIHVCAKGLESNYVLGNHLVVLFVECGCLSGAQQVFSRLAYQNVYSWTLLIQGYIDRGQVQHALGLMPQMQEASVVPNKYTFVALLKACAKLKCIERGQEVYTEIAKEGLDKDIFIGSILVDMYAKCNCLDEAREVFDELPVRNVVSWTVLIEGYTEHGLVEEALACLEQMRVDDVSPDAVTMVCSLKGCGSIGAIDRGRELHAEVVLKGFERHFSAGNTLVDMYAKCGSLDEAREIFDTLLVQDIVSWNVLITGYVEHGLAEEALTCFNLLQSEGISPDAVTFVCSLEACSSIRAIDAGRQIHLETINGGQASEPFVGTALVDMYAKCGALADAWDVFDKLQARDVVLWTALIAGYADNGFSEEALKCLELMKLEGTSPNTVTFLCCLKACNCTIGMGRELHFQIAKEGLERDLSVGNTLVDMYAKCGSLQDAKEVFVELPIRDVVSWNALMTGFAEYGFCEEVLSCVHQMELESVTPDLVSWNTLILGLANQEENDNVFKLHAQIFERGLFTNSITIANILKACVNITYLEAGKRLHAQISAQGLQITEVILATAFIGMYSKCGSMADAQKVFDAMPVRDLVAWNALMTGYSQEGVSGHVFSLLKRMKAEGMHPDDVTFLNVLAVCNHVGLVEVGKNFFETLSEDYGVCPNMKHQNCLIDLLGRAGQLAEGMAMLKRMASQPDLSTWTVVLAACQRWGNVELGKYAFERAVQLDGRYLGTFTTMSNIYADAQMWEDMSKIDMMKCHILSCSEPLKCSIEIDDVIHTFPEEKTAHNEGLYFDGIFNLLSVAHRQHDNVKEACACG